MAGEEAIGQGLRRVLSAIPWRRLTYDEARELALRGEHLVEKSGQLVGAPRGVGEAELPALRARLDEAASAGRSGADWYKQARAANTEMSGGDPRVARELAAGQAVYSNQATPSEALGWTLAQRNRGLLEGTEAAGDRNYHYGFQAKQYRGALEGDPEEALGPKTGPYFRHMDPTDESANEVGVNDNWMGRLYGYAGKRDSGGFSESEHSFMHGENTLARDRADVAGIFPEGTDPGVGPWQAAAWVGQRARMLREKYPDMPEAELMERAKSSVPDAMEKHTLFETTEQVPPRGNEHLAGAVDLPLEQRDELTQMLRASKPGEPDPYYRALDMAQRPTTEGLGQFTEQVEDKGPLRFQPAFRRTDTGEVAPVVGFHDMTQVPDSWVDAMDDAGNGVDQGFVDQHGRYYTRQQAASAVREAEAAQAAAELPSRRPMRNKVGESIPYLGSQERAAYEQQYLKNVKGLRGEDLSYVEDELPLDRLEQSHGEPIDKLRTQLYTRGYREGAPPNRILVVPNPDGSYKVLDGNRRVIAARAAGLDRIPALVERKLKPEGLTSERLTTRETHGGQPQQRTDYNPNQTMRPMVSYEAGTTNAPRLDEPSREMVGGVNTLRSAVDAQAAGAYHTVKFTTRPALQNAARVAFPEPLDRELTSLLYERAQADGLNLIDTGGGSFTLTGDFGQMKAGEFLKKARPLLSELEQNGARTRLGTYIGQYNELPQYGEGRVTEKILADVSPRVGKALNTPELRAHYLAKNKAEAEAAGRFGLGAPRQDVQRLRVLLAKGGVEHLRKHVAKYGTVGLPGVALALRGQEEQR